ncbi:hypothetical protein [Butyrivibrio sp. AE3003]|uniref:hypothetical protein n=1 Tax=Butyrivibrio sp. AE3003 TaxID=1496721 RepID=UPI001A9A27E5|nr:hypothetical protein [Butyrivibrio sp. AE3003]
MIIHFFCITLPIRKSSIKSSIKNGVAAKLLSLWLYEMNGSSIPVAGMKREAEMLLFSAMLRYDGK